MMISKPDEALSGEDWCAENGLNPDGTPAVTVPHESEEEWLASMPADVAAEMKAQLDTVSDEYREGADRLFQQHTEQVSDRVKHGQDGSERLDRAQGLTPWSEADLDELCIVTEDDIEAAVESATPKLQDLNTTPPTS
jgi:hypothetical protein